MPQLFFFPSRNRLQIYRDAWVGEESTSLGLSVGDQICHLAEPVRDFNRAIETHKDTENMTCIAANDETLAVGMASGACLVTDMPKTKSSSSGKT